MTDDIKFKQNTLNITIDELENKKSNGLDEHYASFLFGGKDFNIKLMNTLRRVCFNYIPVYAYAPELINISENTSKSQLFKARKWLQAKLDRN